MRDRLPTPGKENRVRITQDNGQVVEGTLAYADGATQAGSTYTKGNVLPDDVCNLLGIDPVASEPKDAWVGVITTLGYSPLKITLLSIAGNPLRGIKIEGLTGVLPEKCVTDQNGEVFVLVDEGDYTLTVPSVVCLDATIPSTQVRVRADGRIQEVTIRQQSNGRTSYSFSGSESFQFSDNVVSVDIWALGGGGGGGSGAFSRTYGYAFRSGGGGGGGGGRTAMRTGIRPTPFATYRATVGSGGSGAGVQSRYTTDTNGDRGYRGGTSSCSLGGVSASGGYGGDGGRHVHDESSLGSGGDGGSGGGAGASPRDSTSVASPGDGGSAGGPGEGSNGDVVATGGRGQGSPTGPYGANDADYAAGGGGGSSYNYQYGMDGGAGGSRYAGAGGRSVGGQGNSYNLPGGNASDGLGGGGGGGPGGIGEGDTSDSTDVYPKSGGDGGRGVVLMRWRTAT